MINKVILVGYVGKFPEMRYMPNGDAVANFSLATSEHWKDKNGEKQESTEWHHIVAYRKLGEIVGIHVSKGALLYVSGKIKTRKWEDAETGKERYKTEIIADSIKMLGGKKANEGDEVSTAIHKSSVDLPDAEQKQSSKSFDDFDDDIPF